MSCYLVVTIGYVYAALYLAMVLVGCLVEALVARSRTGFLRALAIGVISGLVVVTVYLPGVLTAPVTIRSGWEIVGAGSLTFAAGDLVTAVLPNRQTGYLLWLLPMLLWVDVSRVRAVARELVGPAVVTGILLLWLLGPAEIGPIRWPLRIVPALMVSLTIVVVVLVARCAALPPSRARLLASLAWVLVAAYLVGVAHLGRAGRHAAGRRAGRHGPGDGRPPAPPRRRRGGRCWWGPGSWSCSPSSTPSPPCHRRWTGTCPAGAAGYAQQLPTARGDVMIIGGVDRTPNPSMAVREPTIAGELLLAASWYRNPQHVQAGYTTIDYQPFRDRFCRFYNFDTCKSALKRLLATEPTTGRPWVDLLSVSTLVLFRPDFSAGGAAGPARGVAGHRDRTRGR